MNVIVIGGGVAGISAAVHLAERGVSVHLLEQRKYLGGRAGSFEHDIVGGGLVDNCQHVLLGCCTELQSLYRKLGVEHLIRFDDTLHFADLRGRRAIMRAGLLPSPLHLAPSLASFSLLGWGQKLQIVRAMMSMMVAGEQGRDDRADISFGDYLRQHHQSPSTIRDYWDVIAVSALNEECNTASAKYGMQVFQQGFLETRRGYQLGYARAPLSELYWHLGHINVRRGAGVDSLLIENGRVIGARMVNGESLHADHVILAISASAAAVKLRPLYELDPQLARIENLKFRPIMGVHLLYDREIPITYPISLVGTRLQWLFPDEQRPELLHGVISAADLLPEAQDLTALFDAEVQRLIAPANAKLVEHVIVRESRATFRPVPGVDRSRPTQRTRVPGLTLAGDYTQTNWPATMEGAAISGRLAANTIIPQ